MAKRLHDTEIWKQDWFLEMDHEYRTLWLYIKDACDHAGIWKPEKRFVEFLTGKRLDFQKALSCFNRDKPRIEVLANGRWLIPDFIAFQYGRNLNMNNRVHHSIFKLLEANGVKLGSIRGLDDPKDRVKDIDKDKDSLGVVKKEGSGEKTKRFSTPTAHQAALYAVSIAYRGFDAQRFCDYYSSKGWMIGKTPMKDWKAAVRTWKRNDEEKGGANGHDDSAGILGLPD